MKSNLRKPLIIAVSKKLLMSKEVKSDLKNFSENSEMVKVYDDDIKDKSKVKRVYCCSGQFYFHMVNERN